MRRKVVVTAVALTGLALLWQRWTGEESVAEARSTPPASTAAPRAVQTRLSPDLPPAPEAPPEAPEVDPGGVSEAFLASLPEPRGQVRFRVETESGEAVDQWYVESQDCRLSWSSRLEGVPLLAPEGSCAFQAWRFDGALKARSPTVSAHIVPNELVEILLTLPDERTGGLGVQIREHELGVEVLRVFPDTPADELGLSPGDLIVEVDGVEAVDLDLEAFIDAMTGPEGSEVDFALAWEGDTGLVFDDVTLIRGYLDGDPGTGRFKGARFAERTFDFLEDVAR